MKLKYVANSGRKRSAGALLAGFFLFLPFAATLFMVLSDLQTSLRDGTWMIPIVWLVGLSVCAWFYLTPTAYLRLDPKTRTATLVDGKTRTDFTFAALGPLRLVARPIPAKRNHFHYSVESGAVPVVFYVDSLVEPAAAKALKLGEFLGVPCEIERKVQPMMAIDE